MSEMIERVARAVRRDRMVRTGAGKSFDPTVPPSAIELNDASAALKAMREPTPEMIAAAWRVLNPCGKKCIEQYGLGPAVGEAWRAMINAALAEKGTPAPTQDSEPRPGIFQAERIEEEP